MIRRHNMPPLDDKDLDVVLNYLEAAYPPRVANGSRRLAKPICQVSFCHVTERPSFALADFISRVKAFQRLKRSRSSCKSKVSEM